MAYQPAKHDGTEFFAIPFSIDHAIYYYPVPGGVMMEVRRMGAAPVAVFVPMVQLFFELTETGDAAHVYLESTIASQLNELVRTAAKIPSVDNFEGG